MTYCGIFYMYVVIIYEDLIVAFCCEQGVILGCHSAVFLRPSTKFMA